MNYELNKHKKSDTVKWIVSFSLIFVLLVGMITSLVLSIKAQSKPNENQETASLKFTDIVNDSIETVSDETNNNNQITPMKVMSMSLTMSDAPVSSPVLTSFGAEVPMMTTATQGITKTVTATVQPESAVNKKLNWSLAWASGGSLSSATISQYITLTYTETNNYATICCIKAFPDNEIILTCTSQDSGVSSSVSLVCDGIPSDLTINSGNKTGTATWNKTNEYQIELTNAINYVGQKFYDNATIVSTTVSGTYKKHDCYIARKTGEVSNITNEASGNIADLNLVTSSISSGKLILTLGSYPLGTYSYKNAADSNRTRYIYKDYVYEVNDFAITVVINTGGSNYTLNFSGYVGVTGITLNTDTIIF